MAQFRTPAFTWFLSAVILPLLVLAAAPVRSQPVQQPFVTKVSVQGNRLIETDTIMARLRTAVGDSFDPETVSEDIRSVYSLGYFDDVRVESAGFEGGLAVTFVVREKKVIRRIEFRGNKELKSDELRTRAGIKASTVVDDYELKMSLERLLDLLHERGYYRAKAEYRLDEATETEVDLIYVITEGERLSVTDIRIVGNETFSDREIRKVMKTDEKGLFSFITRSGTLQARQLEEDGLRIRAFLYNNGHVTARVDEPKISVDEEKRSITVTVSLHEGPRFTVGALTAPDDEHYTSGEILEVMRIRPGQVFRSDLFARDISAVTTLYTDIGYAFCRVDSRTSLNAEAQTVDVELVIDKGPLVRVGRITISGNQVTRDNVIRREFVLREGETFSSKKLARSRQRIMNLGFFESVEVNTMRPSEDVIDLALEVKEKLTGMLTLGAGYSSEDKLGGILRVTQDNLFGRGHKLQASVEYSSTRQEYSILFSNPSVFDSPYSLGFKLYDQTKDYTEYDKTSTGGSVTVGHTLGEFFRGYLSFKSEAVEVSNLEEGVSNIIAEQEGRYTTRSTSLKLIRDSRDNYFNPTRGSTLQFRTEYAGGFQGGDNSFTKNEVEGIVFFPLWKKLVFSIHAQYGQVQGFEDREVPIYERFFLGGINSVRGYQSRSIGPEDENGDPIGGHRMVLGNAELVFPISEEQKLMGVIFFDAGQAFGEDEAVDLSTVRTSVGTGVRWFSPIGPFRIEWGYILDPEPGEQRSDWQFSIGTAF